MMNVRQVHRGFVLQKLGEFKLADTAKCIYVSGSFARGWAHALSDLDVYVVYEAGHVPSAAKQRAVTVNEYPGIRPPGVPLFVTWTQALRWDVELWDKSQVLQVIDSVMPGEREGDPGGPAADAVVDFLYRISIGHAITNKSFLDGLKEAVAETSVIARVVRRALADADGLLEDAAGFLEAGQLELASVAAHLGYGRTVDAMVATQGEFQPGPKWRPARVRATPGTGVNWNSYWAIESKANMQALGAAAWTEMVVRESRSLASSIDVIALLKQEC